MNVGLRKMIALLGGVVVLAGMVGPVFAGQGEQVFAQAVKLYQAGDYAKSIELNERLIKEIGVESAAVYFNLGNSYFKRGELGRAILSFLRAQRIAPRDADIKQNLSFARQSVERYEAEKKMPDTLRWLAIFRFLSDNELKWLVALAIMVTGSVFLAGLYTGLPRKRVVLVTVSSCVFTIYVFIAYAAGFVDANGSSVVLKKVDARFEPTGQATVYFKVSEGEELKIIRHKDGWTKVERGDGRQGWVPAETAGEI